MEYGVFRISKEAAEKLAKSGLTELEKRWVVKKLWELEIAREQAEQEFIA